MVKKNWINELSTTPKYLQIVNAIISEIEDGHLKKGDLLPSVNNLIMQYDISRDTVVKAYEVLKRQEIIDSVPGKGNYVKATNYKPKARIFLLFNKLSTHKKIIYDSFVSTLGEDVSIDFYIYNNSFKIFKTILTEHLSKNYTHFVIIAHFNEGGENLLELLRKIPLEKLFILDKKIPGFFEDYACVYQDFQKDIYLALSKALLYIKKYKTLKIIFPPNSYHPHEILIGLKLFCQQNNFNYIILSDLTHEVMHIGDLYINLMESDLVTLIKKAKLSNLKIGTDVGIISYNETPLKEVLLDGITVISTDFEELGRTCASMILNNEIQQVANKFDLIVRNSL
jgi:DNA-binding transcriptional regulator YhcF (GntR family)